MNEKQQEQETAMGKELISAAPGGGGIDWESYSGKLLVVEPLEVEHMVTQFSKGAEQECVRANVYVVLSKDGSKHEDFEDTLIFPRVLISQTKRKIGKIVVGRLSQGNAKPGQNPPWELAEAKPADLSAAQAFLSSLTLVSAGGGSTSGSDDAADEFEDDGDAF